VWKWYNSSGNVQLSLGFLQVKLSMKSKTYHGKLNRGDESK